MSMKKTLDGAKKVKNDEFYTQLTDIEKELKNYRVHFKDKVILCNCDDPEWSNFWKYFELNFEFLGLKKLIATHYDSRKDAYVLIKTKDKIIKENLEGNGDFRSVECISFLKEADIVVTNPPFSLFREYIAQLFEYNKKFVILGNTNAITYKEVFNLIKDEKLWLGVTNFNVGMYFYVPDSFDKFHKIEGNRKMVRVSTSCWYTNLQHDKRNEEMVLFKKYNPKNYVKYENYDAINVDKVTDIPTDYDGDIGVPITFINKYNPKQFRIIKFRKGNDDKDLRIKGKSLYFRIIIRKR